MTDEAGTRTGEVMEAIRHKMATRALAGRREAALDPQLRRYHARVAVDRGRGLRPAGGSKA